MPFTARATTTVATISLPRLWEFLWSPRDADWLQVLDAGPRPGQLVELAGPAGLPRRGSVVSVGPGQVELEMATPPGTTTGAGTTTATLRAEDGPDGVVLQATEKGFTDPGAAQVAQRAWQSALTEVAKQAVEADERADRPRQAVVIIHGMGRQRPGETLRDFADSGAVEVANDPRPSHWVKPDRLSRSFELRSYSFKATTGQVRPHTDVYEVYWANLVSGTSLGQVVSWAGGLLLRRLPPALAPTIWVARAVLAALALAVGAVLAGWWDLPRWLAPGGLLAVGALWAWRSLGRGILIDVVGDVARYLRPDPENVAIREAVRAQGVDLLEALHEDGRYDRIVVLGHSLGSVVAYDILTQLWIRRHRRHDGAAVGFAATRAVERAASGTWRPTPGLPAVSAEQAQTLQHEAWREQRRNGQRWLVTDLVTVGSPLTYGRYLLAGDEGQFDQFVADRILPVCPPIVEESGHPGPRMQWRCSYEQQYRDPAGRRATFTQYHHAAPFAVTRWTNLYFPVSRLGLGGDIVAGPVAPQFGPWVHDIQLARVRRIAHCDYWRKDVSGGAHIAALGAALKLDEGWELRSLAAQLPLADGPRRRRRQPPRTT